MADSARYLRSRTGSRRLRDIAASHQGSRQLSREDTAKLLRYGEIAGGALVPWGSNYTYYVMLSCDGLQHRAVYKPRAGEAPLIDFPSGTLYLREYAAYLTSEWLDWDLVPATVIREGPYGIGSLQIYVEAERAPHVYALDARDMPDLQKLVLFDVLVNNADRKPAHCFKGVNHGLWAIDHGLTFHARPKLRTVIWDFVGEPIPEHLLASLEAASDDSTRVRELNSQLRPLLSSHEVDAFWRRVDEVRQRRVYPILDPRRNIPYGFA